MTRRSEDKTSQVSEAMIRSIFMELKSNGYTDGQIAALSEGLAMMASHSAPVRSGTGSLLRLAIQPPGRAETVDSSEGLFLIGCPEGFESLCL